MASNRAAFDFFKEQIEAARKHRDLVSRIVREESRFLELASTLHYFVRDDYSREAAAGEVLRVKADKNFTNAEIQQAWLFLEELQAEAARIH